MQIGCSENKITTTNQTEANKEYFNAMRNFDKKNYTVSLRSFEDVSKKYSLHKITKNSLMMEIFLNYLLEKYIESYSLADMYINLYPFEVENIEYVRYLKILSKSKLISDHESSNIEAIETRGLINDFLKKYQNSKYKNDLSKKLNYANEFIIKSILSIGDEYCKMNNYIAAYNKYQSALKYDPNSQLIIEEIDKVKKRIL